MRNRIYAQTFDLKWIEETMPGAERRRQRAAFRRGLALATTVALVVLGVIGLLGYTALRQRDENRRHLYISDINLAEQASEAHDTHRVLDLLGRHIPRRSEPDLRGFEWYKLWNEASAIRPVRQIELSNDTMNVFASTDGRTIYTGEGSDVVERDLETGARLRTVLHSTRPITPLAMSDDRRMLAQSDSNGVLTVFDVTTGSQFGGPAPISLPKTLVWPNVEQYIRFSPDDRFVVTEPGHTVMVWQIPEWKLIASHEVHGELRRMALSPDGRMIAFGTRTAVEIWSRDFGRRIAAFSANQVGPLTFCPDSTCLAIGDYGLVHLFRLASGRETTFTGGQGFFNSLVLSSDGTQALSSGNDGTARMWNVSSTLQTAIFQADPDGGAVVLFFNGRRAITAGYPNRQIRVWDLDNRAPEMLNADEVYTTAFSPDGSRFVSGGNDGKVAVWDTVRHARLATIDGGERINRLDFVDASTILVSSAHRASLWNLTTLQIEKALARSNQHLFAALSPDRTRVAIADEETKEVRVLHLAGSEQAEVFPGSAFAGGGALAFGPDSRLLAFISGGHVYVWAGLGQPARVLALKNEGIAIAFSPDGKQLVVGQTGNLPILVWDWRKNRVLRELVGPRGAVKSLRFSPDGSRLVSTADDGTVRFWDGRSFDPILTINESEQSLETVAFSPDGKSVAIAGDDHKIRLWDGSKTH